MPFNDVYCGYSHILRVFEPQTTVAGHYPHNRWPQAALYPYRCDGGRRDPGQPLPHAIIIINDVIPRQPAARHYYGWIQTLTSSPARRNCDDWPHCSCERTDDVNILEEITPVTVITTQMQRLRAFSTAPRCIVCLLLNPLQYVYCILLLQWYSPYAGGWLMEERHAWWLLLRILWCDVPFLTWPLPWY